MPIKNLTCIIVDDDDFSRGTLEDIVSEIPELEIIRSLKESEMAIKYLATLKPDITFLDINMPRKNGMQIQQEIIDLNISTKVIFTTSHPEHLMDALKNNAFDYIIKPVKKNDIAEALSRLKNTSNEIVSEKVNKNPNKIIIQNSRGTTLYNPEQIGYIEADGCYTKIHLTSGKTEVMSKNLGKIEMLFPHTHFFKISRSYIVNVALLQRINRIKKTVQIVLNGKAIVLKASREKLYNLETLIHKR